MNNNKDILLSLIETVSGDEMVTRLARQLVNASTKREIGTLNALFSDFIEAENDLKIQMGVKTTTEEIKEHLDQIPSFIETLVEMDGFKKSIVLKVQEIIFITPSNCKNKTIITVHGIDGALLSSESFENIKDKIRKALY
jgi:hypothetical protein